MSKVDIVSAAAATTPDAGRVDFCTLTRDIATYYGMDKDPEKEAFIGRIVHDIIDDLNTKKLWRFNLITAADITTVSGTQTYALPADFWRIYNTRKKNDIDYALTAISEHTLDLVFASQNAITGFPYVTADFNIYRDGTLKLFPIPDGVYTITVRYFKLIGKPSGCENLDMPPPFQTVPKYGALARLGAMVGSPMAVYWQARFDEAYQDMNKMDEDIGDEDLRFINIEEMFYRWSYQSPGIRPRFVDLY